MKTYKELYTLVEEQISSLQYDRKPKELYDPITYVLSLGGKRLRPVLVLMAADLFGENAGRALPAALAIEMFHNFTLVHDDIMDHAPLRRGRPTVHHKWNETVAILSGDLMMIKAMDLLCETDTDNLKQLIAVFNKAAAEVCEGQQIDMNFESRSDVRVDEYLEMITLKTAVLLGTSLRIGAMIAGASTEDALCIYEFGRNIGIAFQIQDDILDAFGEGEKVGKKIGGDIVANKKTLLYLKACELADDNTKVKLHHFYSKTAQNESEKIAAVMELFRRLNVLEEAEELKTAYLNRAFQYLSRLTLDAARTKILRETANELMQRMS